jgi:regulatory protein
MDAKTLEEARKIAYHYLEYAARTRSEIATRLAKAGFDAEVATQIVEDFAAKGWLDDAAFAQAWIEDRADRKKYGKRRLALELQRKGVDEESLQAALEGVLEEEELERAFALAERRWDAEETAEWDSQTRAAEKRKLTDFLFRRGFSWATIKQVFARLKEN